MFTEPPWIYVSTTPAEATMARTRDSLLIKDLAVGVFGIETLWRTQAPAKLPEVHETIERLLMFMLFCQVGNIFKTLPNVNVKVWPPIH